MRWLVAFLLLAAPARASDLTVLTAGAFKPVVAAIVPEFETSTGHTVILRNDTVGALVRRINTGESFDIVLVSPAGLQQLGEKIAPGSSTILAKVGVGVGVKAGAEKPNISTVAAFKAAMLNARSVAFIDPKSGGSSGIYVAKLFESLGIADAMAPKSVLVNGGLAAEPVTSGQAEIVVQQISEIVAVPGVTLVGPLPYEIQNEIVYAGAIAANAPSLDAARAFLSTLASSAGHSVLIKKGMMPP